jgi:hypothetical protein
MVDHLGNVMFNWVVPGGHVYLQGFLSTSSNYIPGQDAVHFSITRTLHSKRVRLAFSNSVVSRHTLMYTVPSLVADLGVLGRHCFYLVNLYRCSTLPPQRITNLEANQSAQQIDVPSGDPSKAEQRSLAVPLQRDGDNTTKATAGALTL